MNRYIVEQRPPATAHSAERFAVVDTQTKRECGIYPDKDAAKEQAMHLNRHPGEVGAPITPKKSDWNPIDD